MTAFSASDRSVWHVNQSHAALANCLTVSTCESRGDFLLLIIFVLCGISIPATQRVEGIRAGSEPVKRQFWRSFLGLKTRGKRTQVRSVTVASNLSCKSHKKLYITYVTIYNTIYNNLYHIYTYGKVTLYGREVCRASSETSPTELRTQSDCLSHCLFCLLCLGCLSVSPSVCQSVCLSACLSLCQPALSVMSVSNFLCLFLSVFCPF